MIGISIRLALALGLHLRNENPAAEASRKRMLVQTWWTLRSVECLISIITGRPPIIGLADATVPLPYSAEEEEREPRGDPLHKRFAYSSVGTQKSGETSELSHDRHFINHIRLTIIAQEVLVDLYSPRTITTSWQVIRPP